MRIGGGCATVMGYKLPKPLVEAVVRKARAGKAEARFEALSQDTGLAVLVVAVANLPGLGPGVIWPAANFSVNEKDEASPLNGLSAEFVECLHSRLVGV